MKKEHTAEKEERIDEILIKAFKLFYDFVQNCAGRKKTMAFAEQSHKKISNYFHNLSIFDLTDSEELQINGDNIGDKEILAFSVWMQQFIKELRSYMIGVGQIDPAEITNELRAPLKKIRFYEYYDKSAELNY